MVDWERLPLLWSSLPPGLRWEDQIIIVIATQVALYCQHQTNLSKYHTYPLPSLPQWSEFIVQQKGNNLLTIYNLPLVCPVWNMQAPIVRTSAPRHSCQLTQEFSFRVVSMQSYGQACKAWTVNILCSPFSIQFILKSEKGLSIAIKIFWAQVPCSNLT